MQVESRIGLGTVQFGLPYGISNRHGKTPPSEVSTILATALNLGVDLLDTASSYGSSEEVLGQHDLNSFRIVTKFLSSEGSASIEQQLSQSLKNLGQETLFGYLAHMPDSLANRPEQWEELLLLKEQGRVGKVGYSLYRPEQLESLLNEGFVPDLIQVPYNYFDRRFEPWFQRLKEMGCEIHTRSAFLQGLFFVKPEKLSPFFDGVKPALSELQKTTGRLAGPLLRFVLDQQHIDRVIIGVENHKQLTHTMKSLISLDSPEPGFTLPDLDGTVPEQILIPSEWPDA